MAFKSEQEFIAWVESIETWIKNHIERHHNSSPASVDSLLPATVEHDIAPQVAVGVNGGTDVATALISDQTPTFKPAVAPEGPTA